MAVPVGFALPPERETLALLEELILEEPDYYEVAPETLWTLGPNGELVPNGYHRRFELLRAETARPFVAHGVGYSPSGLGPVDDARRARWREAIGRSHAALDFDWYSDHLGATVLGDRNLLLPMPVPLVEAVAERTRSRLLQLRTVVPLVAVENTAFYFLLGEALDEPEFLAHALDGEGLHLVLDLHNLFVNARNHGYDPDRWLQQAPLEKVIELHVSGGSSSDPAWLPGGATRLLDSHDDVVPPEVWRLLEEVAPRCPALRGVTLERMEGTVAADDVPRLKEEVCRVRELVA